MLFILVYQEYLSSEQYPTDYNVLVRLLAMVLKHPDIIVVSFLFFSPYPAPGLPSSTLFSFFHPPLIFQEGL